MSATFVNHDSGLGFVGSDLPGATGADRFCAALNASLHWSPAGPQRPALRRTDLQRLAMAVEALTRATSDAMEAAVPSGLEIGLARFITEADARARAMRNAIAKERFQLAYQPVVSLADRSLLHFEALLRPIPSESAPPWTTQEFVTFSEETGLVEDLDLAVLARALAALQAAPGTRIAVNFSGLSIQSRRFQDRALALIGGGMQEDAGRRSAGQAPSPSRLLIELTETAEITDSSTAASTLARLRGAGVAVCLDDFGAGAAAFRYLRDFHFDFVKIDGAYVRAAAAGRQARDFVASMRALAHSVGAPVIAERIETEAEASVMAELGVEFGQGWLFGRPGPLPVAQT